MIKKNSVITMHYEVKDDSGHLVDKSEKDQPLVYLQGSKQIIVGLEKALAGRKAGDKFSVSIEPKEAYGERNEDLQHHMGKDQFEGIENLEVGMQLEGENDRGEFTVITIKKIDADKVLVDGNHPLAGEKLHFEVSIEDVRDASAEELSHGHAHGPDGHHHH